MAEFDGLLPCLRARYDTRLLPCLSHMSSTTELKADLAQAFDPAAAGNMDYVIELAIEDTRVLCFSVSGGELKFLDAHSNKVDVTFYFCDHQTMTNLLFSKADAFDAFMAGEFRSSGYLMLTFALMEIFRSSSLPPTPID